MDLRSAFDSVNRRLLFESLLEIGLPSCFVAIIAAMYRKVKFVVKVMGKFSRLVTSHFGAKQGYTLSPKLFSLFVNDLESFMKNNEAPFVSLDWFRLSCMLFADDIVVVADSRENLQKQLDLTQDYLENKD